MENNTVYAKPGEEPEKGLCMSRGTFAERRRRRRREKNPLCQAFTFPFAVGRSGAAENNPPSQSRRFPPQAQEKQLRRDPKKAFLGISTD